MMPMAIMAPVKPEPVQRRTIGMATRLNMKAAKGMASFMWIA